MSDAAITVAVTGAVQIVATVAAFLTLWVKLKYGADKAADAAVAANVAVLKTEAVESKVEHNTRLTEQTKDAASAMRQHSDACSNEINRLATIAAEHHARISALESSMGKLTTMVDATGKNIDSTRHEMRGHLQTVTNQLATILLAARGAATVEEKK